MRVCCSPSGNSPGTRFQKSNTPVQQTFTNHLLEKTFENKPVRIFLGFQSSLCWDHLSIDRSCHLQAVLNTMPVLAKTAPDSVEGRRLAPERARRPPCELSSPLARTQSGMLRAAASEAPRNVPVWRRKKSNQWKDFKGTGCSVGEIFLAEDRAHSAFSSCHDSREKGLPLELNASGPDGCPGMK